MKRPRILTIIAALVLIALFAYRLFLGEDPTNHPKAVFNRQIQDTIDVDKYLSQYMPDNPIGVTSGRIGYVISGYNDTENDQQAMTAVRCMPASDADALIAYASFAGSRQFVYGHNKTWFRKNTGNKKIYQTDLSAYHPICARLINEASLLITQIDSASHSLNFLQIDTTGATIQHKDFAITDELCQQLRLGAAILENDSNYYLVAKYAPLAVVVSKATGRVASYPLLGTPTQPDGSFDPVQPPVAQNSLAKFHYNSGLICILNNVPDQPTPKTPSFSTCYLDFYDDQMRYQYTLVLKNEPFEKISDVEVIEQEFYLVEGRRLVSGHYKAPDDRQDLADMED